MVVDVEPRDAGDVDDVEAEFLVEESLVVVVVAVLVLVSLPCSELFSSSSRSRLCNKNMAL